MPIKAFYLPAATTGADGRVYVIGGAADGNVPSGATQVYTPSTNTWAESAPMPVPGGGLAAVTAPDGRIYAIGSDQDSG